MMLSPLFAAVPLKPALLVDGWTDGILQMIVSKEPQSESSFN